jgi:hypothetical protein
MKGLNISRRIQPGLWEVTRRDTGVRFWMAVSNGITTISYDENYVRLWLSREQDNADPSEPSSPASDLSA